MTMEPGTSDQSSPGAQQTPLTPPTTPGALVTAARQSAWPTVVGIIAITFVGGEILLNIWAEITPVIFGWMARMPGAGGGQFAAMKPFAILQSGIAILSILVSVLLMVVGICLVQRQSKARTLLLAWAVLRFVVVPMADYIGCLAQQAQFGVMAGGQNMPAMMGGFFGAIAVFGVAFTLLWG